MPESVGVLPDGGLSAWFLSGEADEESSGEELLDDGLLDEVLLGLEVELELGLLVGVAGAVVHGGGL